MIRDDPNTERTEQRVELSNISLNMNEPTKTSDVERDAESEEVPSKWSVESFVNYLTSFVGVKIRFVD